MGTTGKKAIFFPRQIGLIIAYLQNILSKLNGGLAAKYSTTPAFIALLGGYITSVTAAINKAIADAATAQASTNAQNTLLGTVHEDVFDELTRIQNHDDFSEEDMEQLGARKLHVKIDPNVTPPVISHHTITMTEVELDFPKMGQPGIMVYGSYDGSTFTELGKDFRSPFNDRRQNRVPGTPENRYYKLRFLDAKEEPVGLESQVLRVVVLID